MLKGITTFYKEYGMAVIIVWLGSLGTYAQSGNFDWAQSMGGAGADMGQAVIADVNGNVYITGHFAAAGSDFNPGGSGGALTSAGLNDAFLSKYDPNGVFLWAKSMGGDGSDVAQGITIDDNGNVYITGQFASAAADFNSGGSGGALTSTGGSDVFVAKYDPNGNFLWAKSMGGVGSDKGYGVATDASGNVYVTGQFAGADFSPGGSDEILTWTGASDVFVTKYDANGSFLWAKSMGGAGVDIGQGVAVAGNGNVYITGSFTAMADFNTGGSGGVLTPAFSLDGFVAGYNPDGTFLWAKSMGGTGFNAGTGVTADVNGNVAVTGIFTATADFDPDGSGGVLTAMAGLDVFVVKYDANGGFLWAEGMGGTGDDRSEGVAMDAVGNVYVTGWFGTAGAFFDAGADTDTLSSAGDTDVFVAKYDTDGNYVWAKGVGGAGADQGWGVTTNSNTNVYVTGQFASAGADFNPGGSGGAATSAGGQDAFVLKLSCNDTSSSYLNVSACSESYTMNGIVYTTSGIYTQYLYNTSGCDSTIILDLSFFQLDPIITIEIDTLSTTVIYTTYQWFKNNILIPGATNRKYTVTENADYRVAVTNEDGCTDTSAIYTVSNHGVGIDYTSEIGKQINSYPNPAENILYINSPVIVDAELTFIDGRTIIKQKNAKQIAVKGLSPGVYFLRLSDGEGTMIKVEKIVKE